MKTWHWGVLVLLVLAYFVGVKWPSVGTSLLGKVGM